jgi:hypothetical protein
MAIQTYLVSCRPEGGVETIKDVAGYIRGLDGVILMAAREGAIIAAFDDALVDTVRTYQGVDQVSGIALDPRRATQAALQRVLRAHLALQGTGAGTAGGPG